MYDDEEPKSHQNYPVVVFHESQEKTTSGLT